MRRKKALRWIALAAGAVVLLVAGRALPVADWHAAFGEWLTGLGPAAYPLYAVAYVVMTVILGPAWLMTIGAGLFFGLLPGTAVVSAGSTLGAAAAFLIGRHLARERVTRMAAKNPRFAAIDRAVASKGWKIVFLLRLSPLVPYTLSNYFYGLTAIRFWPYVLASWVGMIPLTLLYASFGAAGRSADDDAPDALSEWKWPLIAGGVVITLAATAYVARVARRAVEEEREEEERAGEGPTI